MIQKRQDKNNNSVHVFDRRSFLRTSVGTGITSTVAVTGSVSAQETSGGDGIWKFETGDFVVSSPTVVDGTVYVGSNDETVYAINAETGEQEWAFTEPSDMVRSSPSVRNGTAYVGSDDGFLYAIDTGTGEERWSIEVGVGDLSSPIAHDGMVYICGQNSLYALDTDSGTEQWIFEQNEAFFTEISPVIHNGTIYLGNGPASPDEPGVYAIDSGSGEEVWSSTAPNGLVRPSVAVSEGLVFAGSTDLDSDEQTLFAIDSSTGETEWTFETNGRPHTSPTVESGTVFIGTVEEYEENEHRGTLHAIDTVTGEEEWRFSDPDTNIASSPTVADDTVYFGASGVYAVDAETGDELWQFGDPAVGRSSPTVVDGIVFFGLDDSTLYAVDAGVDSSSQDSRVLQGTLGHHHEWAGQSSQSLDPVVSYSEEDEDNGSNPASTVFRQFTGSNSSPLLWALAGLGTVGGAYVGYKKLLATDDSTEPDASSANDHSVNSSRKPNLTISEYNGIQIGETIKKTSDYQIQEGTIRDHHIRVLKPSLEESQTVSTAVFETFSENVDPWVGMDSHPHLVTTFGAGTEPVPWAAIEDADDTTLVDHVDTLSTEETVEALEKVCEALHHVHRYGTEYMNLTTESVLYTNDAGVKLRGILDQFDEPDPWYNAPEEFDAETTEKSVVYRIGLIAYELLTGTLPYPEYPTGDPETVILNGELIAPSDHITDLSEDIDRVLLRILSASPDDRFETVLHLRDEFEAIRSTL